MANLKPGQNLAALVNRRREIVADYITRGQDRFNLILEAWLEAGIVNPDTQQPFNYYTYQKDRKIIIETWKKYYAEKVDETIVKAIARHEKIFEMALNDSDYKSALDALKGLRDMLDLDKPKGSRALKQAADERQQLYNDNGMTEAESNETAAILDNSPAVLGEVLQIMRDSGALDAALIIETEQAKQARLLDIETSQTVPALPNGNTSNGNGTH